MRERCSRESGRRKVHPAPQRQAARIPSLHGQRGTARLRKSQDHGGDGLLLRDDGSRRILRRNLRLHGFRLPREDGRLQAHRIHPLGLAVRFEVHLPRILRHLAAFLLGTSKRNQRKRGHGPVLRGLPVRDQEQRLQQIRERHGNRQHPGSAHEEVRGRDRL